MAARDGRARRGRADAAGSAGASDVGGSAGALSDAAGSSAAPEGVSPAAGSSATMAGASAGMAGASAASGRAARSRAASAEVSAWTALSPAPPCSASGDLGPGAAFFRRLAFAALSFNGAVASGGRRPPPSGVSVDAPLLRAGSSGARGRRSRLAGGAFGTGAAAAAVESGAGSPPFQMTSSWTGASLAGSGVSLAGAKQARRLLLTPVQRCRAAASWPSEHELYQPALCRACGHFDLQLFGELAQLDDGLHMQRSIIQEMTSFKKDGRGAAKGQGRTATAISRVTACSTQCSK